MSEGKKSKVCDVCMEKSSQYCCPRCGILYCSLDCYKSEKHSDCSESFYRDCVNEELGSQYSTDESRRQMIDILKKINETDSADPDVEEILRDDDNDYENIDSDDNNEVDLMDRMKDIDLNDADAVWEALNEDEKNEFVALINKGEVSDLISHWEPWWLYHDEDKLVEDVNAGNEKLTEALKKCPPIKEVQKLSSLTTIQPSPAIKFNIVNVISSYAFVMRYFNGELEPLEGASYILNVCSNLESFTNFDNIATAVESVNQKCMQSDLIYTDQESLQTMKRDTYLIIRGPNSDNNLYYCKAALSHTYQIFHEAKKAITVLKSAGDHPKSAKETGSEFSKKFPDHGTVHIPDLDISKVKKCTKKLEYYLSFVESFGLNFETELLQ